MTAFRITLVALLALGLSACVSHEQRVKQQQARLTAVHAAAGEPISSFFYPMGGFYSWEALGKQELLVFTRPNRAYLLNVGLCPDLPWTTFIGISTHTGSVNTLSDHIVTDTGLVPCYIRTIRPVDVDQLKVTASKRGDSKALPAAASSS